MAFTTLYENTYTISNSEKSLTTGSAYSGSSLQTTDNDLWIYLNTADMAADDRGLIRVYEKVVSSGSAVLVYEYSISKGYVPPINLAAIGNGWDVVAIRTAGADFDLAFSLRDQTAAGGSGLDAAGVRAAVGLASANLDIQLSTIDTVVDGVKAKTDNLPASPAATDDIPTADITAILADTNELQANQGNWVTATGFATPTNVSNAQSAIQADIAALSAPDNAGIAAIQAKTDQLAFTAGNVNANTKAMNDAAVLGNGTEANLWRGA